MNPASHQDDEQKYLSNLYSKKSHEDAKNMAMNLKFEDIPIPSGFKLDYNDSFMFNNDFSRVGILRYIGRTDVNSLITFFKTQMPMYNWKVVNMMEYRRVILNFEKETQTCTLIIEPSGGRMVITIASGPIAH